jgi:RHS repeat-associated protein
MTSQSTADNSTGAQLSQVPSIHSFEFDKGSIGQIKTSVNQFRGSVSLPITFMTLPGRQGLDVKIAALYASNVKDQVTTWNLEAPTGILGLGWQMPFDFIAVDKHNSGSAVGDDYYLVTNGSASPLVKVGDLNGVWSFQLRSYEFWQIQYDTRAETWKIVKEDGSTFTYGGLDAAAQAIQWGVRWGNWIGSSSVRAGQERYPVAWNLAAITSAWGDQVTYRYDNVDRAVGSADGLAFTQASYIKTILDSFGRTVTFNYGEKYGARNPSPRGIVEYQAQNSQRPEPNAYQNKYETRYLDSVAVANAQGEPLYSLQLTYDFLNLAATSDPSYPLLWKRCLRSVFQQGPGGETLSSLRFEYNGQADANPGALRSVTYPEGGTARFTYKKNFIKAPKSITLNNPLPGSTPGVWHGSDYVVFTYCMPGGALKVLACSWNGRWVEQDITAATMGSANADPASLWVSPQADSIAIAFRNQTAGRDELYLFRKDRSQFGGWTLYRGAAQILPVKSAAGPSTFVAGKDFVIAFNKDYTGNAFQGFSYDWKSAAWATPVPLPSSTDGRAASGVSLAAAPDYYLVTFYSAAARSATFQIFYRDPGGAWKSSAAWSNGNLDISISEGRLLFAWNPQPAYAVATYVTGSTADTIRYSLRTFQWDKDFRVLNAGAPVVVDLTTTVPGGKPRYDVFRTIAAGSFVANNPANQRSIGGDLSTGGSANWLRKDFTLQSATSTVAFAAGEDVAAVCETFTGGQRNQLLAFDPNNSSSAGWSFPGGLSQSGTVPTVGGNYLTVGRSIYFRKTDGTWQLLSVQLSNLGSEASVQNRAPSYIAYQDGDGAGAKSYVVTLRNGGAAQPVQLGGAQKIYVPAGESRPGTVLAGRFLVGYPSSSPSFDKAASFSLYNLDGGDLADFAFDYPVAYLEIENPFDPQTSYVQSYFYANSEQSQIAYNPATGITQYPLVYSLPGVRSLDEAPPSAQPQGRSVYFYSNGLSPQAALSYPRGWIYNYQNILNGMLLAQQDYDSNNRLVSSQINYWQIYTQEAATGAFLFGAYVRLVRTTTQKDGIQQDSTTEPAPTTGLPRWQEQTYCDTDGQMKKLRTESKYAWEVPQYASDFLARHFFTAVVQTTQSVSGSQGENRVYIASKVTTYRNWAASGASRLGPLQVFQWTSPGAAAPVFDFAGTGGAAWLRTAEIAGRSVPAGMIEEQIDSNGVTSSFLYDREQRYLVAKFPNGSLKGGEVGYTGFESYETDPGWTLGSGAAIVPNDAHPEIDAHSGERSLRLEAGATGGAGVARTFKPQRRQSYVFSAWVKKPQGFNPAQGDARWTITAGGSAVTLSFPATAGLWVYVSQVIDLPTAGASVEIRGENANSASYVLIDDLRFSPLSCLFEATPYDTRFWMPDGLLGANGESSRTVYDVFQQPVYYTNAADQVSKVTRTYSSRQGNQGRFSTSDPGFTLDLRPADGGELYTFDRGPEWQELWQSSPANGWRIAAGRLTQTGASGALRITDPRYAADYSLAATFACLETVTKPLGARLGAGLTVQWDPATLRWQLLDGNGSPLAPAVDTQRFQLPATPYTAQLDAGQVSPDLQAAFRDAGYPLPAGSTVAAGTLSKQWILTGPDPRIRYYLMPAGSTIGVYQVGGDWTFLVGERTLLFWAGGQRIFSYLAPAALAAQPELFFGNRVALSALASGRRPQARINFEDSRGNPLQGQLLAGAQAVVSQTLTDSMGRQAVLTKPAYVAPVADRPLLAYRGDFAALDWQTGRMTGLIAAAYPEDAGYPYSRQLYETSAAGRLVEQGLPGEPFRVGAHSTKIAYGADVGTLGLPPNQFFRTTTVDPNGDTYYEITTQLGQTAGKVSIKNSAGGPVRITNATRFDAAGNPVEMRAPNYYAPPQGSTAGDWAIVQAFDYAGRVRSTRSGDGGVTRFIYDRPGNLRFLQDPQGAADGTYNYWKYDLLGRPVESGYLAGAWNEAQLQASADTDPAWPPTPPTWRKQSFYDGGQANRYSIGRVYRILVNNGAAGTADVTETFSYDVYGNTAGTGLTAAAFDAQRTDQVDYGYDNLANITRITYPKTADGQRLEVFYRYSPLNQVTAISTAADFSSPLASYTYAATGRPQQEVVNPGGQPVTRAFGFNSPLWINSLEDRKADSSLVFGETLSYTDGGFNGAGYFDGTIAATGFQSGGGSPYSFQYSYNSLGQIENGGSAQHPDWNLGVTSPLAYDPNGNFLSSAQGGAARQYEYFPGTQKVEKVWDPASGAVYSQYQYDKNGNAIRSDTFAGGAPRHQLTLAYDPGTRMTRGISDAAPGGQSLGFQYGSYNQRILKEVRQGSNLLARKLYVRGTSSYPLFEATAGGGSSPSEVLYIFGPSGIVAMRQGGQQYAVLRDHLGSVRRVLNANAEVVASYDYLPFGSLAAVTEPAAGFMPYLFTGQEYDREVGLYNYRARFYASDLGRFLAGDPKRQYFSPYLYAANNPVLYIDPSGEFSIGSFFSAIGGAIIGAVEILIGVAIDIVAGVLEVVTGGLSTPVSVGLAALAGTFYGAGVGAITYSVFNFNDFSWKDYGIQMGVGAAVGAITFGFGALGAAAAEGATGVQAAIEAGVQVSRAARAGSALIEGAFNVAGGVVATTVSDLATGVTPGADLGWSVVSSVAGAVIPGPSYKAGWGNFGKRVLAGVAKDEAIGLSVNLASNAAAGNSLDTGLLNTAFSGALSGSMGALQVQSATKREVNDFLDSIAAVSFA